MADPDYPTNWDVHEVPLCSKCGNPVPHTSPRPGYFMATEYQTDGTDGWHNGECPEGGD